MGLNIDPISMTTAAKIGSVCILSYRSAISSAEGRFPAVIFETGFGFVPHSMPPLSTTYNCTHGLTIRCEEIKIFYTVPSPDQEG